MTADNILEKFQWMEAEARAAQANLQRLQMRPHLLLDLFAAIRESQCPPAELAKARRLLAEFVSVDDDSVCRFDHHRACQEHGLRSLELGELCPYIEARQYLAEIQEEKP
ncbi:hypothetical protein [Nocardia sp. NPDC049149]|uniref:hypothetical protein n=1 Tax=Nocardia sp. NPDC049149 TaxID=3364315 RepID=UPI00371DEB20